MNSPHPFPPYSSDEFTSSPFVIGPSILLGTLVLCGLRYLFHHQQVESRPLSPFSKLLVTLSLIVVSSYLMDAIVIVSRSIFESAFSLTLCFYVGISWLAWSLSLVALAFETKMYAKWYWTQYLFWIVAALSDTVVGWEWAVATMKSKQDGFTIYDHILLVVFVTRYIAEITLTILSAFHLFNTNHPHSSETAPLLGSATTENYGTSQQQQQQQQQPKVFTNFIDKMKKLFPYIWPYNNKKLQLYIVLCFLIMCAGFVVGVLTPLQIGRLVDSLGKGKFAWSIVLVYIGLKFLQGGSGLLQSLQNWLWIPIGQYTTREISIKAFSHLHNLSLDFHIGRKTGEVLRILDRGTNSISSLLSQMLFQIFPAIVNIGLAVIVCAYVFSPSFGLILFLTMSLYIFVSITMTEWRTKFRRAAIEKDNYARTKAVDSLLNFETVKYYNAESFEINRYKDAMVSYQEADWKSSVSLNILNLTQNAVITGGLLAGCLLFAWEVSQGRSTPGDFVSFNMYMMQLYTPLHWLGTYYRMIQSNFIDMEKMLELLDENQSIKDAPDAKDLEVSKGNVVFDNVTFAYDNRQTALNGISFTIPKGATVALVGPSGGGKSTILRLLFRFYDPLSGSICVDGQDIKKVTQLSLRKNIGIVPQDTVLFNDTIYYNIQYGDVDASETQVKRAAKAAQIHDRIETFPDGYETKVGERGLRLSGGEKQRVAIARTILKDPPIILLDEATSALDTTTERNIQQALSDLSKDRTTLVIAHRLSTIVNADLILVIKDGQVVESGNHEELIRKGTLNDEGAIYYEMWQKQLHDESETLNEEELAESDDEFSEDQNIKKLTESHPKLDLSNVDTKKKDDAIFVSSPIEEEPEAQQTNDVKITQDDETSNTDEGLTSGSSKDAKNSSASSSNSSNKKSKKKKKSKSKSKTTF